MENEIQKLYEDNDFPGIEKLYLLARNKGLKVSRKEVALVVMNNRVHQLYKKPPKKSNHPIVAPANDIEYQMDLLDMSKFYATNSHYRYILIMIDIFSRRGFATPIKTKSAENTLEGIKKGFEYLGVPKIIASDNGSEFLGVVSKFFSEKNIAQKMNEVGDHNVLGVIDRFAKTIKEKIYKYFSQNDNTKCVFC